MINNPFESKEFALFARLTEKSLTESAGVTNWLMDSYQAQAKRAETELDIVRDRILGLLAGQWMPMPDVLRAVLWPTDEELDAACGTHENAGPETEGVIQP